MADHNTNIPYSPEYFDLVIDTDKKFEGQIETILNVAQGEFVILKETESIPLLLKTIFLLRRVVKELVFQSKTGLKIILFTNISDSVIRSKDINAHFADLSLIGSHKNQSQIIDLDKIWYEQNLDSEIDGIKASFEKIQKTMSSPVSLSLIGSRSSALILLIASKLTSDTKELLYQKDSNSTPERIF